jgi:hypothetical protein
MKRAFAFVGALLAASPAIAKTGHILQVHHGNDCVEFVLVEEAIAACGVNAYTPPNGAVYDVCLQTVPWYGIAIPLTPDQLPTFINLANAIETAYRLFTETLLLENVQSGEGFSQPSNEAGALDVVTAVGFDLNNVTLQCKNLGASSGKHTTNGIGNINLPPAPNQ